MKDDFLLSAPHRFGFQLSVLARQWRRILERQLEHSGLTDATWAPLVHLHELGDGITQTELAGRVGLDTSSLVRLLDILAGKGFIERRVNESDRRARLIVLTREGQSAVREIRRTLSQAEERMLAGFDRQELEGLVEAFRTIGDRLRAIEADPETGE